LLKLKSVLESLASFFLGIRGKTLAWKSAITWVFCKQDCNKLLSKLALGFIHLGLASFLEFW
jgi:hypothetical protein